MKKGAMDNRTKVKEHYSQGDGDAVGNDNKVNDMMSSCRSSNTENIMDDCRHIQKRHVVVAGTVLLLVIVAAAIVGVWDDTQVIHLESKNVFGHEHVILNEQRKINSFSTLRRRRRLAVNRGNDINKNNNKNDPKSVQWKPSKASLQSNREVIEVPSVPPKVASPSLAIKASRPPPILINLGQGNTATHAFFLATCYLNMTSFHYFGLCHDPSLKNVQLLNLQQVKALASHQQAMDIILIWRTCMLHSDEEEFLDKDCSMESTIQNMNLLKDAVRNVVTSGGVQALHDVPYAHMGQFLTSLNDNENTPSKIFIMSQRDSSTWVERREEAHGNGQFFCRALFDQHRDFFENYDENPFDPFDYTRCLDEALRKSSSRPLLKFTDVFVSFPRLMKETLFENGHKKNQPYRQKEEFFIHQMTQAMTYYQQFYQTQLSYEIDLFSLPEEISFPQLAIDMFESMEAKASQQKTTNSVIQSSDIKTMKQCGIGLDNNNGDGLSISFIPDGIRKAEDGEQFLKDALRIYESTLRKEEKVPLEEAI